jgi:hypothetical protein
MRRYIHRFLSDDMEVTTVSEGEGKWRKVILKLEPKQPQTTTEAATEAAKQETKEPVSADNAACDCVVSAESTTCACIASTTEVAQGIAPESKAEELASNATENAAEIPNPTVNVEACAVVVSTETVAQPVVENTAAEPVAQPENTANKTEI